MKTDLDSADCLSGLMLDKLVAASCNGVSVSLNSFEHSLSVSTIYVISATGCISDVSFGSFGVSFSSTKLVISLLSCRIYSSEDCMTRENAELGIFTDFRGLVFCGEFTMLCLTGRSAV